MLRYTWLICLGWCWCSVGQAQEVIVSRSLAGTSWAAALEQLEAAEQVRIYIDPTLLQEKVVPDHATPLALDSLLQLGFPDIPLTISRLGQQIFITSTPLDLAIRQRPVTPAYVPLPKATASASSLPKIKPRLAAEEVDTFARVIFGDSLRLTKSQVTLSGYVRAETGGEPLAGVSITIPVLQTGTFSDAYGFFSLTIPVGEHIVVFRSVGKEAQPRPIGLYSNATLEVNLRDEIRELDEVLIESDRNANVKRTQMGVARVGIETLKQIPALMGEVDIIKSALLLPGVQTVGEGAGGFQVRGGTAGQNLVLLNQAPIYNTSHLFGFFSVFNADLIQRFDLYKSGVPARLGGRVSSVMEVQMKDGNKQKWVGRLGVSPITGRFSVEGPLVKGKSSLVLGGRGSFTNWILNRLEDADLRNSRAQFYDLSGKVNWEIGPKDRIDLSGYFSDDEFFLNSDTAYDYQNLNGALNWKHLFNNRLFAVSSAVFSQYVFGVSSESNPTTAFRIDYRIRHHELKTDFTFIPTPKHQIKAGANLIYYRLLPGRQLPLSDSSLVNGVVLNEEQAFEGGIYLSDEWNINNRLSLYGGLRWSGFGIVGPYEARLYQPEQPRQVQNILDTLQFSGLSLLDGYGGPEIRFSGRYTINENSSLKLSYNRMRQYLHMLSNTTAISPTDTWKLSDPYIRPQVGDQVSLGYYRDFLRGGLETSVEIYGKSIQDLIEFKNGAQLLLNPAVETDVVQGRGRAYGIECLVRKTRGRFTGWLSYTFARTFVQINGEFPDEVINGGEYFPANVDKPHDLTFVANYKISRRLSFSTTATYSTGRPITFPVGRYNIGNSVLLNYSERNQFRVPDYVRWDFSAFFEGNHKKNKFLHSSWSFSVYNTLGRQNVYSIYFVSENRRLQGYRLSIFGRPIPTITLTLRHS